MPTPANNNVVAADTNDTLPLGERLDHWTPPPHPPRTAMPGQYCTLEPLDIDRHSRALFTANNQDPHHRIWTYLPYGPFETLAAYQQWMRATCLSDDPLFFAVINNATGQAEGVASYLRITPAAGSIEVGHINYAPPLQHTRRATEAMYLMMKTAFTLGYRRYEWKCNALNQNSRKAALRLGFQYEGTFRQMMVVKGRNRDSAWFSVIDKEWATLRAGFEGWLAAGNFDADGGQRRGLVGFRAEGGG